MGILPFSSSPAADRDRRRGSRCAFVEPVEARDAARARQVIGRGDDQHRAPAAARVASCVVKAEVLPGRERARLRAARRSGGTPRFTARSPITSASTSAECAAPPREDEVARRCPLRYSRTARLDAAALAQRRPCRRARRGSRARSPTSIGFGGPRLREHRLDLARRWARRARSRSRAVRRSRTRARARAQARTHALQPQLLDEVAGDLVRCSINRELRRAAEAGREQAAVGDLQAREAAPARRARRRRGRAAACPSGAPR